jgi:predicted  nucleic acid-binding Zn-ribbon protein
MISKALPPDPVELRSFFRAIYNGSWKDDQLRNSLVDAFYVKDVRWFGSADDFTKLGHMIVMNAKELRADISTEQLMEMLSRKGIHVVVQKEDEDKILFADRPKNTIVLTYRLVGQTGTRIFAAASPPPPPTAYETDVVDMRNKIVETEEKIADADWKLLARMNKLEKVQGYIKIVNDQIKSHHEDLMDKKKKHEALEAEIEALGLGNAALLARKNKLDAEGLQLRAAVKRTKEMCNKSKAEEKAALVDLRCQLAKIHSEADDAMTAIQKKTVEVQEAKSRFYAVEREKDALESEFKAVCIQATEVQETIREARAKLEAAEGEKAAVEGSIGDAARSIRELIDQNLHRLKRGVEDALHEIEARMKNNTVLRLMEN